MNGLDYRMRRILNPGTGRSLVIAIDHGYALGPIAGIVDVGKTIRELDATGKVDAWLLTGGVFRYAFDPTGNPGVILRISGGATIAGPDITREGVVSSVNEGLALAADAVAVSAFIGSQYEHETLLGLARTAEECHRWNMPLLGVIGLGKEVGEKKHDAQFIALGARVAAEHGADHQLVLDNRLADRFGQGAGVSDAGGAAVADHVKTQLVQIRGEPGTLQVAGDHL